MVGRINEQNSLLKALDFHESQFVVVYGLYQLMDNFTLFHHQFLDSSPSRSSGKWLTSVATPAQNVWRGLAFERLCLQHIDQIKAKLGIAGVFTRECSWTQRKSKSVLQGAQIDLLIDRADNVINLCEMKWSAGPYELTAEEGRKLRMRREVFRQVTGTRKSVHLTLVTPEGAMETPERHELQSEVTLDDLFAS